MILSIVNHKGGTGKTTTAINLGSALAALGQKTLLVDFDAQGSLSFSLGLHDAVVNIADALHGEVEADKVIQTREGMDILPAGRALADVELAIAKSDGRFYHLKNLLTTLHEYDFILIDCPPSLSLLTLNALAASEFAIIPMQMDVLALRGLDSILQTMKEIKNINADIDVLGVLPVMIDERKNIHHEILKYIKSNYKVNVFKQSIHSSVKAAEAPSFGESVVRYASSSTTANDYCSLAKEVLSLTYVMQSSITNI